MTSDIQYRRFQEEDATFFAGLDRAFCLDDPRTGKTVKMLLAATRRGAQRLAVITRAITRAQWKRECAKWAPDMTCKVWGYEELTLSLVKQQSFRLFKPDVLLLDEAQQVKNPDAKRTRLIYGPGCKGTGLESYASATWILSGTLTPNHLAEAWPHFRGLGLTTMTYLEFAQHFCETYTGPYGLVIKGLKPGREDEYKALLQHCTRRRRYRDVFPDAAKPRWSNVALTVSPAARAAIATIEQDAAMVAVRRALAQATSDEERMRILAAARPHTSALRNGLTAVRTPLIADEAEALLESGVPKLVIMAWHHATLDGLQERLQRYTVVRVDGGTADKDAQVQRFQTDPKVRVFLGQIKAAGEGIPLHAARTMMLAEWPWSVGDVVQATQRIVSGDCPDAPEIIACTMPGTIDDIVAQTVQRKAAALGLFNDL